MLIYLICLTLFATSNQQDIYGNQVCVVAYSKMLTNIAAHKN